MPSIFSDYVRKTVPFLGGTVALDIRALTKAESPEFLKATSEIHKKWSTEYERKKIIVDGEEVLETDESYAPRVRAMLQEVDAFCIQTLSKQMETKNGTKGYYVRLPETLVNEDDDSKNITDCAGLLARGGQTFGFAILTEIASLAEVDPVLAKTSGSPSTSTVEAGPATTESPVSIIDDTASVKLSTAPVTQTFPVPFSRPA